MELREKIAKEIYEQLDGSFIVYKTEWEDTHYSVKEMYFEISDKIQKVTTKHNYRNAFHV